MPADHVGRDWATIAVRLKGCTLIVGSVHLSVGHQTGIFSEVNAQKVHQLKTHLAASAAPFVLAGDWNRAPADLLSITWLDDIGADIVVPEALPPLALAARATSLTTGSSPGRCCQPYCR
jgi:hypothetical protein